MTPVSTRIILLGRIAIERDGAPAPAAGLPGRRSELVFAYLAVEHRRGVSRDELANALWPVMLPDTWNAALRGVISDVRRFLERSGLDPAETLLTEQGRLHLKLPAGGVLDIDEARVALGRARELLAAGQAGAASEAAARAADAAALPFLSFHDDGWASGVRSELDRLHIDALELQAQALAEAGDPRGALVAADRLVRADPFLEAAHRLRITMLGETGDRAGALKAFDRCEAMLASELGIQPSPETADALRKALQGTAVAEPGLEPPSPPAVSRFGAYSVLVVEDHAFQRRTTLTLLRGLGIRDLQDAADGAAALALLDGRAAPDVIVCDIDMPGMDGVEFIRNVAERQLASAVVIASGLDGRVLETVRAASEGYGLQVLGAVGKPLTAAALEGLLAGYRPPPKVVLGANDPSASVTALAAALADRSLVTAFEPIVDLAAGRIAGFRAAVASPAPHDLLVAADAAGLGRQLVEHLLRDAHVAAGGLGLDAFVELPASLLSDVSLADALAAIARDRIVLVASAAALAADHSPAMLDLLARLRVKGYGLCIDGFDAGALARLPLTHARLPTELVEAAALDGDAAPLQTALEASRLLGVPVVGRCATAAEFELLLQVGCSFAHGPFLAEPVAAGQLATIARDWTAPPVAVDHSR